MKVVRTKAALCGNAKILSTVLCLLGAFLPLCAQTTSTQPKNTVSEADRLRGEYGPYRANNDLLYYHLDVRVDPEHQMLSGKNVITPVTTRWQTMKTPLDSAHFDVATDLYYVDVRKS